MLPPSDGGLHCGTTRLGCGYPWDASAPAVRRRAPLRQACTSLVTSALVPVLPPFSGGLHCGRIRLNGHDVAELVLPPFDGGLHCGYADGRAARQDNAGCSRRSAAGSIAARRRATTRRADQVGVLPPFNGGLHCGTYRAMPTPSADPAGAPAGGRRAPLRLATGRARCQVPSQAVLVRRSTAGSIAAPGQVGDLGERRRRVLPPVRRRAPLRQPDRRHAARRRPRVLPPFDGGLHCGGSPAAPSPVPVCSRRSAAGSIAAQCRGCRRPARSAARRRAPLRHDVRHVGERMRGVLPPFSGGLHCGSLYSVCLSDCGHMLPPFDGGLHCGGGLTYTADPDHPRVPAGHRRAPLRHACDRMSVASVLPPFDGGLHCGTCRSSCVA